MKVGRPSEYKPEFCSTIIECGKIGQSVVSRCVAIGITRVTYWRWCDPDGEFYNPEFHAAHLLAEEHCQHWWEERGRVHMTEEYGEGARGTKLNGNVYRLHMMNRFGWGENNRNENKNENIDVTISKAKPTE